MRKIITFVCGILVLIILQIQLAQSQTTEFSYQGSLRNGAPPANGIHDFEFALFDALPGGAQVGTTIDGTFLCPEIDL